MNTVKYQVMWRGMYTFLANGIELDNTVKDLFKRGIAPAEIKIEVTAQDAKAAGKKTKKGRTVITANGGYDDSKVGDDEPFEVIL